MDPRRALTLIAVLLVGLGASQAGAATYVRVLTQQASVRTGPAASYRAMHTARRGEVLPVKERGTRGFWFLVELDDGSKGWILGDQVAPFEVLQDRDRGFFGRTWDGIRGALLGPSPVPYASMELAFSAGALGGEGVFLFRPAFFIDQYFALELFLGESPAAQEDILLGGVGWTLRLLPGAAVGPFVHIGVGVAHRIPKADAFALETRTQAVAEIGAGIEITFKKRITLRADFRQWVFFDENASADAQEYSGGLAIFF
jgi:uncharacterized protein YgiM (DUF1202 family)